MPEIYRRSSDGAPAGDSVPFFLDGTYHLFHLSCPIDSLGQQYPYRCTTQQRHATSTDLIQWTELPTALVPSESYDADGCWTGSLVERDGTFYLFYTGHTAGATNPQTICLATGTDGVSFTKVADNPLISPDPDRYEPIDFRDPYVFFNEEAGEYWMLIAARFNHGPAHRRGNILKATSTDLLTWSSAEPFYSPWTTACPECPEMFKLGDWWYLVYSHFSESMRTTYRISRSANGPWRTPPTPGLDGRRFYAAKSMPTADADRRLMWGSIYERIGQDNKSDWTYAGDFGVVRELRSTADGSLTIGVPAEVINAFGAAEPLTLDAAMGEWQTAPSTASVESISTFSYATTTVPEHDGVQLIQATLQVEDQGGEFGLLIRPAADLSRAHALVFDPQRQRVTLTLQPQTLDPFWAGLTKADVPPAQIDGPHLIDRPVAIKPGQPLSVAVFVQDSLLEIFVNNEVAMSYRLYPDAEPLRIGAFAQDTTLTVTELAVSR